MTDEKDRKIAELEDRLRALEGRASPTADPAPAEPPRAASSPMTTKKESNSARTWLFVCGGIVALLVVLGFLFETPPPYQPDPAVAAYDAGAGTGTPPTAPVGWIYTDRTDPMTDATDSMACVDSTNQARLSPPYDYVTARLCIRQSQQHGTDVFVRLLGDGQIICRSYNNCTVDVRFGTGEQSAFSAAGAADHASNIIFVTNTRRFIAGASDADITRVQLTFYQDGEQILEFPTEGLEWPRPAPAS